MSTKIAIKVLHENPDGSLGICGYVGKNKAGAYRLTNPKNAQTYASKAAADAAEAQYLIHIEHTCAERRNTTRFEQVEAPA